MGHQTLPDDTFISLQDVNGHTVLVSRRELLITIQERGIMVLGLDLAAISALRDRYLADGGPMPITEIQVRGFAVAEGPRT